MLKIKFYFRMDPVLRSFISTTRISWSGQALIVYQTSNDGPIQKKQDVGEFSGSIYIMLGLFQFLLFSGAG